MSEDDEFTPKSGKGAGTKDAGRLRKYGARVLVAARLAGRKTGVMAKRFDGSRIGRGASMGRLLSSRDRLAGFRGRRAVVKTRLVRLGPKGIGTAKAHLRYIQRDGVTREGAPGELYGRDVDQADGASFLERSAGDRHQFRLIVSAEDGAEYPDLKPFIRRLMSQAETDLGTKLDWVAVDHFNTERAHTHLMLRGVDDKGDNLIIAPEYIAHGFRERAAAIVTLDLGPRTTQEIEARLRHDVEQERLTAIDRRLLRRMDTDRVVTAADRDPFQQSIAAGRLRRLGSMGLAKDLGSGRWRLDGGLEETLRRMGERGDIIRTMQRELTARKLASERPDRVIETELRQPLIGRVLHRGLIDEERDRHFLLIDGIDGRVHHVLIGRGDATEATPEGSVVRIVPQSAAPRDVDRRIAEVAEAHGGRYSVQLHRTGDPRASASFAETHVRRLEALRRGRAGVERHEDGSWTIRADHAERALAHDQRQLRDRPVDVEILSRKPVEQLTRVDAPTWLERTMLAPSSAPVRDSGYGREVRQAWAQRARWLIEQDLATGDGQALALRPQAIDTLERRAVNWLATGLERDLGKTFVPARTGEAVSGVISRRVDVEGSPFALLERAHEFSLVPWRPVLERQIGKSASGIVRADGISWTFSRPRAGPNWEV
nr:relaxase/mobilization nuclease RlxS [Sphingomonas sp. Y57]